MSGDKPRSSFLQEAMRIRSYRMNKISTIVMAIVFSIAGSLFAADTTGVVYKVFTPTGAGKSVLVKSGDKQLKYFVVEKGVSFGFNVTGPIKVKIMTRAEFKPGLKDLNYEIQTWEANHLVKGRKAKTTPSALSLGSLNIGLARDMIIEVPEGTHSYRLWITSDKTDRYYVRFYQTGAAAATEPDYSQPSQFKQQVTLVSGNNLQAYYLVDATGGVTLTVSGPSYLQIFCRANYDHDMKGRAKYTLGMYEEGREITQFSGVVSMSSKVQFKELSELIPSTLNTYSYNVPAGKHIYQFKKLESASPNLALRFRVAKSSGLGLTQ
jgi:hypothetical protein